MPELPEIEMLRRALSATLVGRTIVGVEVRLPKVFRAAPGLGTEDVVGAKVQGLRRRGKHLVLDLSNGLSLVFHLRLTGQVVQVRGGELVAAGGHPVPEFGSPLPHRATHLIFELDEGGRLYVTDIRQFGFCLLMPTSEVTGFLDAQRLGLDALGPDLTEEALRGILRQRRTARLKSLLLDQTAIAGLGNIYADEALWLARLNPLRPAGSWSPEEAARLQRSIREVLDHALVHGVARVVNGRAAADRDFPRVHGREGERCPRCGATVERIRVDGRSTYFCPACQPESDSPAA
jgi:formamidopyrimidine-DNA glycosylase